MYNITLKFFLFLNQYVLIRWGKTICFHPICENLSFFKQNKDRYSGMYNITLKKLINAFWLDGAKQYVFTSFADLSFFKQETGTDTIPPSENYGKGETTHLCVLGQPHKDGVQLHCSENMVCSQNLSISLDESLGGNWRCTLNNKQRELGEDGSCQKEKHSILSAPQMEHYYFFMGQTFCYFYICF